MFLRRRTLPLAVLLLLGAFGCEGDQVARQVPKLVLLPAPGSTIDFGMVTTGDTVDPARIVAKNEGSAALVFSEIVLEGTDQVTVVDAPTSLSPGASQMMFVELRPSVAGPIDGALVLRSNDPDLPEAKLFVAGTVLEPCAIRFLPTNVPFAIGETKTVRLENTTSTACRIVNLQTDDTFFPVLNLPELPYVLEPHASIDLEIEHTAAAFRGQPVRPLTAKAVGGAQATATLVGEDRVSCLTLTRDELGYFGVEAGSRAINTTSLVSACAHTVTITNLTVQSAEGGFEISAATPAPIVIPPGGRGRIDIAFAPEPGPNFFANGIVSIETDDFADRLFIVRLEGFVVRPQGTVHPRLIDFGPVIYEPTAGAGSPSTCASEAQEILVINQGGVTLTVRELELDAASEFEISFVEVAGLLLTDYTPPIDIPIGERARIGVRYRPSVIGAQSSRLRIKHDADDRSIHVGLEGEGEARSQITEVFQQPTQLEVDILWSIDASCSMSDEQQLLINNLSQFVSYADAQGVDYQMAVVEAEEVTFNAGRFHRCAPHPAVIHSSYMDSTIRNEAFECMFDLGVAGSGVESALGGARRAIDLALGPDQNPSTNPNAGFVRPNAELVIVAISDEDDQSATPDVVLRDLFFSAKDGQRNRVSVHAIAGNVPNGCSGAQAGHRYANLARMTNGQFYSICQTDWSPLLTNLGLDVFTPEDQWYLSRPADESTIVVTIDGVMVANSPTNGWFYEPSRQLIIFTGASTPPPGSEIVVTYMPGCSL